MREYLTPGVYFEKPDAVAPGLIGRRTDIAAFVGIAVSGPLRVPVAVESFRQFETHFGGFTGNAYLAYTVRSFFENGGHRCYVVRVAAGSGAGAAASAFVDISDTDGSPVWRIAASSPGIWGNELSVSLDARYPAQASTAPGGFTDRYAEVNTVAGFQRGALVRLTQDGVEHWRVISWIDAPNRRLYWVHPQAGRGLPYDRRLTGLDPAKVLRVAALEYMLVVHQHGRTVAGYHDLNRVEEHERFAGRRLAEPDYERYLRQPGELAAPPAPVVIEPLDPGAASIPLPLDIDPGSMLQLANGRDGLAALSAEDFIGEPVDPRDSDIVRSTKQRGIKALGRVDEIAVIAVPDIHIRPDPDPAYEPVERPVPDPCVSCPPPPEPLAPVNQPVSVLEQPPLFSETDIYKVQAAMIEHCERHRDRFALLDPPWFAARADALGVGAVLDWRQRFDSRGAALYYPWARVVEPRGISLVRDIPPCGHVAGQYAFVDLNEGVHRAPANRRMEWLQDVTVKVDANTHGLLNQVSINVIRSDAGRGLRVLGARTLASDPDWRYVNVWRLLMMIMETLEEALQWAVFEGNDHRTRNKIQLAVGSFLVALWQQGALVGDEPAAAFFVKCDEANNPPEARANGRLICDIGVAPVNPFEFVVLRVGRQNNAFEVSDISLARAA